MKQRILFIAAAALALVLGSFMAVGQTDVEPNPPVRQPSTAPASPRAARAARGRAARGATRPTTSAARRGAATATAASRPAILPEEFAILNAQNPFARPGAAASDGRGAGGRAGAAGPNGGPEANILYAGSILEDDKFTAFLEDSNSKKTTKMSVGDSVARGQITAIDLDSLTYEMNGNSLRITVGQNLLGQTPPPPATQPANPQPTGAPQPGAPAAARRGAAARGRAGANVANPGPQPVPQNGGDQ
jgi:hypothetical protein